MDCRRYVLVLVGVVALAAFAGSEARATMEIQKTYKSAFPGKDKYGCTICHEKKIPKKDSAELNVYGKKVLDAAGGKGKTPTEATLKQVEE